MFKKLKDKIAEEVKSSPQRIQQLTQSVVQNISTSDSNLFTIADEDIPNSDSQSNFTEVSLNNTSTPIANSSHYARQRRNSNTSIASDISFLPRYESPSNQYHLQSDLDMSVSEMEDDNTSVSKEQIYQAFRKAQVRYHKYRGRYTDLSNHYRELERENGKMKQVLGETQDKALRRVSELKEQCNLEKSAKAHLENALRVELDEKQYVIDSLKQKLEILDKNEPVNGMEVINELAVLQKDLEDARKEIETLNQRLEANLSTSLNKEQELETIINELRYEGGTEKSQDAMERLKKSLEIKSMELKAKEIAESELKSRISELQKVDESKALEIAQMQSANDCNLSKVLEEHRYAVERIQKESAALLKEQEIVFKNKEADFEKTKESLEAKIAETHAKLAKNITDNHNALEKMQQEQSELRAAAESKNVSFESLVRELGVKLIELETKEAEMQQKLTQTMEESKQSLDKVNREHRETVERMENDLKLKRDEIERMQENIEQVGISRHLFEQLKQENAAIVKEKERIEVELNNVRQETKQGIINLQEKMMEKEEKWKAERENLLQGAKNEESEKLQKKLRYLESDLKDRNDFIELLEKENAKIKEENAGTIRRMAELDNLLKDSKENSSEVIKNYQLQIEHFKQENDEQKSSIEAVKQHLEVLEGKLRSSSQIITALEKQLANVTKEKQRLEETNAKQLKTTEDARKTHENERDCLDKELVECGEIAKHLNDEKQVLLDNLERERKLNKENQSKLLDVTRKSEDLRIAKKKLEACMKNCTEESSTIKETLETERKTNHENVTKLTQVEVALQMLKEEKEKLEMNIENYDKGMTDSESKHEESLRVFTETLENERKAHKEQEKQMEKLSTDLREIGDEKQRLLEEIKNAVARQTETDTEKKHLSEENAKLQENVANLAEMQRNMMQENEHFRQDYENLTAENSSLKGFQRKFQAVSDEKLNLETKINSLREDYNNTVKTSRESYENSQAELAELNKRLENAIQEVTEHKKLINDLENGLETKSQETSIASETIVRLKKLMQEQNEIESVKRLETELKQLRIQLGHAEHQLIEVVNEKQLLQDELNELKISPIEKSVAVKCSENFNLASNYENGENYQQLQLEHDKMLLELRTIEDTNKSAISFYETQVEKLKNKNEKLLRKLDETLVTLSHFSELNGSTEIEYLKNVLYNYMLGKESLVLARVIAAVCKFDPVQTEAVLQKEQQKQTLLGQLGIL